ncbi:AAA family ATPase [Poseidonibacter lekithochrous]|uniref:AAA family ATPase n=1 Tax=Poseidonibacter lekithochrous TaxID=1904463 RepID=UPI0013DA91B6|nr:AAA family ATPase [Poseidonibacter lekithochrous]
MSSKLSVYNHIYAHNNEYFRGYKTIEVDKKGIVNVLVFHYAQSIDFHLSDFMYQPNKIEIKYKDNDSLVELFKRMSSSTEELLKLYNEKEPFQQFLITLCAKDGIDNIEFYDNEEGMIERIGLTRDELTTLHTEFITLNSGREFDFTEENKINIEKYTSREYFDLFDFDLIDVRNRRYNDLSHGEQVLFGLLLNIFFYSKNESKIFLLDEPELSLHPQWQKGLLNQIIKLLEQFTDNKYQLIITSHSPFLLSDLPKENAIFLEKGKQKYPFAESQTFGANIHTLLSDGFFMNNGLMGEFAKEKIEEIKRFYELVKILKYKQFNRLKKLYLKRKKKFRHIQSIIGEPFLQTVIKNYLDELEQIFDNESFKKNKLEKFIKEFGEDEIRAYLGNNND